MSRSWMTLSALLALTLPTQTAGARTAATEPTPIIAESEPVGWPGRNVLPNLSFSDFTDTVSYGGTVWAADSMRWEAIRDGCWTFESGVGSSINTGQNPNKPIGYHQTMEGWYGI